MSALFSKKNREVLLTPLGLNNPCLLYTSLITSWTVAEFIGKGWLSSFDYVSIRANSREDVYKRQGLSFKAGTDDLRCSPIVDVVETLLGKGFNSRIYDKNVKISELTGTNKDFIMAKIPHLQHFVTDNLDVYKRQGISPCAISFPW